MLRTIAFLSALLATAAQAQWRVKTEPLVQVQSFAGNTASIWAYHQPMIARFGNRVYCAILEPYGTGFQQRWSLYERNADDWRQVYSTPRNGQLNQPPSLVVDADGIVHVFAWPDGVFTHYRFDLGQGDEPIVSNPTSPYNDLYPYAGGAANTAGEILSVASAYPQNTFVLFSAETPTGYSGLVARHPALAESPSGFARQAYPFVALQGRAAHVFTTEDIADPQKIDAGLDFVYSFRNLQYYYSADILHQPFIRTQIVNVADSRGWVHNDDLLVDRQGRVHLLYRVQHREGDWGDTRLFHAFGQPGQALTKVELGQPGMFNMGRLWESAEGILYAVLPRFTDLYLAALSPDGNLAQEPVSLGFASTGWNYSGRVFLAAARVSSAGAPQLEGLYTEQLNETTLQIRYFSATPPAPSAIEHSEPNDLAFGLEPPFPNPFNATTLIRFELKRYSAVRLEVINLAGQRLHRLIDAGLEPGWHQARWAGDDSSGAPAAAGQYIVRLRAGHSVQEQKITLVK